MRVIVTGGAGFIGAALVHALVARGDDVHALVHPRTDAWRLDGAPDAHLHRVDLDDGAALAPALAGIGPASVVHTAARGGHPRDHAAMWRDTVLGTVTLLDCLEPVGVERFVHLGSSLEYAPSDRPIRESDPCEPVTARGAAKLAATIAVRQWAVEHDVEAVVLRIFRVYGPGEPPDRLIPALLASLATGEKVPTTAGTTRRDMIHIDDVVEGILRSLESPAAAGQVLNLGSGDEHSVDEIIELFGAAAGRPVPTLPGARPVAVHDVPHWRADMAHTNEVLGWRPTIDLPTGLSMLLDTR
jgi:UDP-glucose 4-epimerase